VNSPCVSTAALCGWLPGSAANNEVFDTLPLADFVTITERIAREESDAALGWSLGLQYDLSKLGAIDCVLRAAPTLAEALTLLVDYFSLVQDASELALSREDGALIIHYRILDPEIWPRHQDAIFTLGIVAQIVKRAAGGGWCDKVQMGVECDDAGRVAPLEQRTGINSRGGTIGNWLRVPASLATLAMPPSPRNPVIS